MVVEEMKLPAAACDADDITNVVSGAVLAAVALRGLLTRDFLCISMANSCLSRVVRGLY